MKKHNLKKSFGKKSLIISAKLYTIRKNEGLNLHQIRDTATHPVDIHKLQYTNSELKVCFIRELFPGKLLTYINKYYLG